MKSVEFTFDEDPDGVTSYAEVWIEIKKLRNLFNRDAVTSYAEVWIEIPDLQSAG